MTRTTSTRLLAAGLAALAATAVAGSAAQGSPSGGLVAHGRGVLAHDGAGASGAPVYAARLAACRRSLRPESRVAVVAATMRPIAGATRFAVKLDLYERAFGAAGWTLRTDVPGLGSWTAPSDPTLGTRAADVFKYRQAVGRLVVQFSYRFRVGFRWLDAGGAIVREETATTRACRQPDLRPDLAISSVRPRASKRISGTVRYVVVVGNRGRTAARRVTVAATLPGDAAPGAHTARVGRLDPGGSAEVSFTGPGCADGELAGPSFQVDPANVVDEADEADNAFALACPVP